MTTKPAKKPAKKPIVSAQELKEIRDEMVFLYDGEIRRLVGDVKKTIRKETAMAAKEDSGKKATKKSTKTQLGEIAVRVAIRRGYVTEGLAGGEGMAAALKAGWIRRDQRYNRPTYRVTAAGRAAFPQYLPKGSKG